MGHTDHGVSPRFIVTTLKDYREVLNERLYCVHGNLEIRIKKSGYRLR